MNRTKELETILAQASDAYYNHGTSELTDKEFDDLQNEYMKLTGKTYGQMQIGAKVDGLKEVVHEYVAKSLDKTKDIDALIKKMVSFGKDKFLLMWKLDGSTIQATYENGNLICAATRGGGDIGSDITHNAPYINGLPTKIKYLGKLVVRGEALMSYDNFEKMNTELPADKQYANPRNLATATIQMLDPSEGVAKRPIDFKAFEIVHIDSDITWNGSKLKNSMDSSFQYLKNLGFGIVDYDIFNNEDDLDFGIDTWSQFANTYNYPVDGLVVALDDREFARTCEGDTEHHPSQAMGYALKWQDEVVETKLIRIEYQTTRTGQISLVAIFEPVELEGTTVERATLHNINFLQEKLGLPFVGQKLWVYKANKIIPAIDHAEPSGGVIDGKEIVVPAEKIIKLPTVCPSCKKPLTLKTSANGTKNLYCENANCISKKIREIVHFAEKDCMDIKGLSEQKIQFLIDNHFIHTGVRDLYLIANEYNSTGMITNEYGESLSTFDGWGKKAVENLVESINKSRNTTFVRFIHAMGIPNVGKGQAKLLAPAIINWVRENPDRISSQDNLMDGLCAMVWSGYDFTQVEGFGEVIAKSITDWVDHELVGFIYRYTPETETNELLYELTFVDVYTDYIKDASDSSISGKTFVITGKVNHYANRDALKEEIENLGGKVSGSVTSKTDFLINNDVTSTSGKNKKAKELNIPIISENDFLQMIND